MDNPIGIREQGTMFVSMATDRDDNIKMNIAQVIDMLTFMSRDIDPRLRHHPDGIRIETMGFNPGREGIKQLTPEMAAPPFRHLAATRISGTEKQYFPPGHHDLFPSRTGLLLYYFCLRQSTTETAAIHT
jgi:hypothetical protein